ncbi:phage holin family protein [Haloflavibacter putidus]|uniref:Holin-X, holin superfamily III n=1 Tax=Haloflavibacter putidus TaxID=2576776 RepID=A0A508A1B2_9FLAO|nr:phage holin family protein [Haloflavibacter putidus]TQD40725.1 hypothetical protein FKR84_01735 [Haloflavibacter putidus]
MGLSNLTNHINDLNENIQAYVQSMLEYYKLDAFKKITKFSSALIKILLMGSLFFMFLAFISVAGAFLIGNAIGSYTLGFLIMGGIYFLLFLFILLFGRPLIDKIILEKVSALYFTSDQQEEVLDKTLENQTVNNQEKPDDENL